MPLSQFGQHKLRVNGKVNAQGHNAGINLARPQSLARKGLSNDDQVANTRIAAATERTAATAIGTALGVTLDGSLALIAIDRIAQSEEYTDEMDKIETYRGFEIRAFEREQGRWRAEIRKADGSMLKIHVGDSRHRTSITTSADTLTAETSIDEVKKAIDAGGLS